MSSVFLVEHVMGLSLLHKYILTRKSDLNDSAIFPPQYISTEYQATTNLDERNRI